jgi:hypothetical protein
MSSLHKFIRSESARVLTVGPKTLFLGLICSIFVTTGAATAETANLISDYQATATYYQNLVEKYHKGEKVQLEEFNRTFFRAPSAPDETKDRSLNCSQGSYAGSCAPDTFYSWGPLKKAETVSDQTKKPEWSRLNNRGFVYVSQTPMATYCYGNYALRFKMKSTASYRGNQYHELKTYLNDWVIKEYFNLADVDSISFGQPEHFDEIILEIQRRLDPTKNWWKAELYIDPMAFPRPAGDPYPNTSLKGRLLNGCVPEVQELSEESLVKNLISFLEVIQQNKGWIHFNHCEKCNKQDHFKTKWPSFFNPS